MKRYTHDSLERAAVRRPPGYIDDVRAHATAITDKFVILTDEAHATLLAKYAPGYTDPGFGPGTELKKLLSSIGIKATDDCPCNKRAKIMNIWGADECESRIDEITGWLKEEAERRGFPFVDSAGRSLIRLAISRARRAL